MEYRNYYVGNLYLFYPDLRGNSIPKLYGRGIFKKRIDGSYKDINSNDIFYTTPKSINVRGIYIDKSSLMHLSDYLDMLYSEGIIQDKNVKNIKELIII